MQHKKYFIGILSILVIGLLITGCGAANVANPSSNGEESPSNGQPNNGVETPVDSGDALPDSQMPEEPIVNLPGEVPYQEKEREPGQGQLSEGNAFLNSADLLIMESYPVQVSLSLEGELPTPCNQLTIDISEPNADNQIHVKVYSLVDPAMTCIAMTEPFATQVRLPLDTLSDGSYEVWVNGTLVGEFTYPG